MCCPPRSIQRRLLVAFALLLATGSIGLAQADPTETAADLLRELFEFPATEPLAIMALQTRADENMLPLFAAMSRSGNREARLLATASVVDVAGVEAAPILLERLRDDSASAIRAEALAQLIRLDAAPVGQLVKAIELNDEMLRCLAARALAKTDPNRATDALTELAASGEPLVAYPARAALLKLGHTEQLETLRDVFEDPDSAPGLLSLLLMQVREEQITQAADLVRSVARSEAPRTMRLGAYQALVAVSPTATDDLLEGVREDPSGLLRVQLLRMLADQPDGPAALEELDSPTEPLRSLVRLELARLGPKEQAAEAALAAAKLDRPVATEYVLTIARRDFQQRGQWAKLYAAALWHIVDAVPPNAQQPRQVHLYAAQAVTILANMNVPEAMEQFQQLLRGDYTAKTRAVAAGLMRSENPAICDLMAPLLDSPYTELAVDAALALGEHGDPRAREALAGIVAESQRYSAPTVALSCWYLLTHSGDARKVAKQLAAEME